MAGRGLFKDKQSNVVPSCAIFCIYCACSGEQSHHFGMDLVLSILIATDPTQKATIWKSHPQRQPPARGIHFTLHSVRLILIPSLRSCKYNLLNYLVIIMLWRRQCVTVPFGVYLQHSQRLLPKSKMCFSSGYVCDFGTKPYLLTYSSLGHRRSDRSVPLCSSNPGVGS